MRAVSTVTAAFLLAACGGSDKRAEPPEPVAAVDHDDDDDRPHRAAAPSTGEDDADDGMQIEGLRGHIDPADIQEAIQPVSGQLARCFDSQVKRRRFLGGQLELSFRVSRDGVVETVQVAKSDLGAWPVERCLLELAAAIEFPEPKGGATAEFSLPLDFPPRKSSLWWTEEQADTEVADHLGDLAECAPQPENVSVTLYVGVRGKVQEVGFASPAKRPIDPEWADCAAEIIRGWTLSDPRGRIAKLGFRYRAE